MMALLGIQKAMKEGKTRRRALAAGLVVAAGAAASVGLLGAFASDQPPLEGPFAERYQIYEAPRAVPEATFTDAGGDSLRLDAFPGEVVVVNFWATWCAPCVEEMPTLEALDTRLRQEGKGRVLALSVDRGGLETVAPFFEDLGLSELPIYLDPDSAVFQALGGQVMPTTYIVDTDGRLVGEMAGPAEWDEGEAAALIDHYVPES